jgi:hypothetical protein
MTMLLVFMITGCSIWLEHRVNQLSDRVKKLEGELNLIRKQ